MGTIGLCPVWCGGARSVRHGQWWVGGPPLWLLLPRALGAAGEECGGARPRPARVVLLSVPAFPRPAQPVTLALAWWPQTWAVHSTAI